MNNHINHFSKGSNIMAKKGDINFGSNPYKLKDDNINIISIKNGQINFNEKK